MLIKYQIYSSINDVSSAKKEIKIAMESLQKISHDIDDKQIMNIAQTLSSIPTYSFKRIVIPRAMTKFLLFGMVLFFGALLVYTFKI